MKVCAIAAALLALAGAPALSTAAEPPSASELLSVLGFSPAEIARIEGGEYLTKKTPPTSERELTASFAFFVKVPPAALVADLRTHPLDSVDPNTLAFGAIAGPPTPAPFQTLTLQPDAEKQAREYVSASPGGSLNLSSAEIASFTALGSSAPLAAVEQAVRSALLARVEAYQAKGLAGIAPYALAGGKQRSPGDELRAATLAATVLQKYAPAAHRMLLDYPNSKVPGTVEVFRWTRLLAHGTPTITLTHALAIPDGDAFVIVHRQFYVSSGYNSEQAVGAFLPARGGTLVVYTNRTSTDQVTGFGGGAKRSIGSKLLSSQLEALFHKAAAEATQGADPS